MTPLLRALAVLCLAATLSTPPAGASSSRSLSISTASNGRISVHGTGWTRGPVALSLATDPWVIGALIRPARSGSFQVAVTGVPSCSAVLVLVSDTRSHHANASRRGLGCPPPEAPMPHLTVVQGRRLHPAVVTLTFPQPQPGVVTVHLTNEIYLFEQGTGSPMFQPTVQARYLALIGQGMILPRTCPQANCTQGFYWKWIAVHRGDTVITLSAACRKANPPCMVPDFLIRVHVER